MVGSAVVSPFIGCGSSDGVAVGSASADGVEPGDALTDGSEAFASGDVSLDGWARLKVVPVRVSLLPPVKEETGRPVDNSNMRMMAMLATNSPTAITVMCFHGRPRSDSPSGFLGGLGVCVNVDPDGDAEAAGAVAAAVSVRGEERSAPRRVSTCALVFCSDCV